MIDEEWKKVQKEINVLVFYSCQTKTVQDGT